MNNTITVEAVVEALKVTEHTFAGYMASLGYATSVKGMSEETKAKFNFQRQVYNDADALLERAAKLDGAIKKGTSKTRGSVCYTNGNNHGVSYKAKLTDDSIIGIAHEKIADERRSSFFKAMREDLLPSEVGITDDMFHKLARLTKKVPSKYHEMNASFNYVITKDGTDKWMSERKQAIEDNRREVADTIPAATVEATTTKTKARKAA